MSHDKHNLTFVNLFIKTIYIYIDIFLCDFAYMLYQGLYEIKFTLFFICGLIQIKWQFKGTLCIYICNCIRTKYDVDSCRYTMKLLKQWRTRHDISSRSTEIVFLIVHVLLINSKMILNTCHKNNVLIDNGLFQTQKVESDKKNSGMNGLSMTFS